MNKIGTGVVLFNPNIKRLEKNISSLLKQSSLVLLVDNGSENIDLVKNIYCENRKIFIIELNQNKGIATALNVIMNFFADHNYDWVLTFDQDSLPPENLLESYIPYLSVDHVGIISPVIWDLSENFEDTVHGNSNYDDIKNCITSGSLTKVSVWKTVGEYDDSMFIDLVDFDFCQRVILNKYRIIRVNKAILRQEIGNTKQIVILGRRIPVDNHSSFRKYYQARNQIYFQKKYGQLSNINTSRELFKLIFKTIMFEHSKIKKLISIRKGIRDGKQLTVQQWKSF